MKKLLSVAFLSLSLLIVAHSTSFAQQHGPTKLGIGLVYGDEPETAGLQAGATFRISQKVAIAPDITVYFPDEEESGFESFVGINLNGHYIFEADPNYHIYGLGGLNITAFETVFDSDSEAELGLNLGLGGEYHLDDFSLFSELKYVVSDLDQVVLGVGARFPLN